MDVVVSVGRLGLDWHSDRFAALDFAGVFVMAFSSHIRWETESSDAQGEDQLSRAHFEELWEVAYLLTCDSDMDEREYKVGVSRLIYLLTVASPTLLQFILGTNLTSEIDQFMKGASE